MGIGLTICQSIIHAHEGRILALNAQEGGAEFRFTLPTG
jgi:K+-sensing histidine kinase KdpD